MKNKIKKFFSKLINSMIINKLKQTFLNLIMLLIVILYCIIMIISWPIFFLGAFIWKNNIFIKMNSFFFDNIPTLPDHNKD